MGCDHFCVILVAKMVAGACRVRQSVHHVQSEEGDAQQSPEGAAHKLPLPKGVDAVLDADSAENHEADCDVGPSRALSGRRVEVDPDRRIERQRLRRRA